MANKEQMIVVRGELYWAKIVGDAAPHTGLPKYDKGPKWSVDVTPNEASRKIIKAAGIADKLKTPKGEKETRKESFLTLSVLENRADGKKNKPPKISSIDGRLWDDSKIGNGSIADLKIKVVDYGDTQGAYLQEVRVLKHIPYEGDDSEGFAPLSEDDEFFGASVDDEVKEADTKGEAGNPDDLDDDIPF
jgi:hypothetical protein